VTKRYKTLEQWIRETLSDTREQTESGKDSACTAIALLYMKPAGGSVDLDIIKLTGKTWNPKDIADRFRGKAETYAQDMGGQQTFQLHAFFGSREPQAFHNFRVVDGEISNGGADRGVKENPDSTGLVAFTMRHLERTQEMFQTLAQGFVARAVEREEKLYAREEKMREELNDAYAIVREMVMNQKRSEFDMDMQRMKFARDAANQERMFAQAPALVNTIAGQEVFPQAVADKSLVDQLCEKVAPEQVDMLVAGGIIPADMAGPLKLRIGQYREEQARKAEAIKSLPAASGIEGETNTNIVPFDRDKDKKKGGNQSGSGAPAAV
jgi:hypothetical protein